MISGDVNYLAVLVGAVVNMALGAYWFSPAGFGKEWAKLADVSTAAAKKGATRSYVIAFVAALVSVFVLANVVRLAGAVTWMEGAVVGFWVWLGFVATTQLGSILWEMKAPKLFAINTAYSLVSLLVTGAILAIWV